MGLEWLLRAQATAAHSEDLSGHPPYDEVRATQPMGGSPCSRLWSLCGGQSLFECQATQREGGGRTLLAQQLAWEPASHRRS